MYSLQNDLSAGIRPSFYAYCPTGTYRSAVRCLEEGTTAITKSKNDRLVGADNKPSSENFGSRAGQQELCGLPA